MFDIKLNPSNGIGLNNELGMQKRLLGFLNDILNYREHSVGCGRW